MRVRVLVPLVDNDLSLSIPFGYVTVVCDARLGANVRTRLGRWATLAAAVALVVSEWGPAAAARAAAASTTSADPALASLPRPTPDGTRPGPPVLYSPSPAAPQLENRDPAFHAA